MLEFESSAGRPLSGVEHSSERTREGGWPRADCGSRQGREARSGAPVRVPRAGVEGRGAGLADRGGRRLLLAQSCSRARASRDERSRAKGERGVLGQVCVGREKC